jgi:hypothetical protein
MNLIILISGFLDIRLSPFYAQVLQVVSFLRFL